MIRVDEDEYEDDEEYEDENHGKQHESRRARILRGAGVVNGWRKIH